MPGWRSPEGRHPVSGRPSSIVPHAGQRPRVERPAPTVARSERVRFTRVRSNAWLGCDADRFESQSPLDSPEGSHALPVNLAQDPVEIRILGNVSGRSVTGRLGYPDEQGLKILKERDAFDAEDGEAIPFVLV